VRSRTLLALAVLVASLSAAAQPLQARPASETEPVIGTGGVVQGVALWEHPTEPANSLLLVADAQVGLLSYRLDGRQSQWLAEGGMLGVDVQPGFPVGGSARSLVVVANQPRQGLVAYVVDPTTLRFVRAPLDVINVPGFMPTSVALYASPTTGRFHVFAGSATGRVHQFELIPQVDGGVESALVRTLEVGGAVVGMAVDDALGWLYVVEQDRAIWRYGAEPTAADSGVAVESVLSGELVAPIGGVSLYTAPNGQGYLLAAHGGMNTVRIYRRQPPHMLLGDVSIIQEGAIDAVVAPRHVVVSRRALGPLFPQGLVAVHDSQNTFENENLKLVTWPELASVFTPPLLVDGRDGPLPDGGLPDGGGGSVPVAPPAPPGQMPPKLEPDGGCGCSVASVPGSVLLVLAGLLPRSRRRRS
jgi:3-phytase